MKAELMYIEEAATLKRKGANDLFQFLRKALNERETIV